MIEFICILSPLSSLLCILWMLISTENSLRFLADSNDERDKWVRALQRVQEVLGTSKSARPSMIAGLPSTPSSERRLLSRAMSIQNP
jgi:hypothetical protein